MSKVFKYALGALPNIPDSRDFVLASFLPEKAIPSFVSYAQQMTPIKNQGRLGSCVAFATTAMKEYYDAKELDTTIDLSEQNLYGECKKIDGYSGEGTYPRTAMSVLLKIGEPEERFQPYEGVYPPRNQPLSGYLDNAALYKIQTYASVTGGLQGIKEALALNGPVGISVWVYSNFYTAPNGVIPMPNNQKEGGHMMCAVGYDDDKKHLIVKNSWGVNWGDKGYCYIPYSVWEAIGLEATSMVDVTNLKHWSDWPDDSLKEQDLVYRNGWLRGYPDGTFKPWSTLTKRHVSLVAGRLGLVTDPRVDFNHDYSPATRGWVRDFIPGLKWDSERWDETLTRYQFVLLLARR